MRVAVIDAFLSSCAKLWIELLDEVGYNVDIIVGLINCRVFYKFSLTR